MTKSIIRKISAAMIVYDESEKTNVQKQQFVCYVRKVARVQPSTALKYLCVFNAIKDNRNFKCYSTSKELQKGIREILALRDMNNEKVKHNTSDYFNNYSGTNSFTKD